MHPSNDSSLYDTVVDLIDRLLETSDILLDSFEGKQSRVISENISIALSVDKDRIFRSNSLDIPKPQLLFMTEIENSREHPFYPKIRFKPHGIVLLNLREMQYSGGEFDDEIEETIRPSYFFPHPYETEILALKVIYLWNFHVLSHLLLIYICKFQYTSLQLANRSGTTPIMPPSDQPFQYIDDEDDFSRAIDEMAGYRELAIDLEHHSHRSFMGITCLMQVRT